MCVCVCVFVFVFVCCVWCIPLYPHYSHYPPSFTCTHACVVCVCVCVYSPSPTLLPLSPFFHLHALVRDNFRCVCAPLLQHIAYAHTHTHTNTHTHDTRVRIMILPALVSHHHHHTTTPPAHTPPAALFVAQSRMVCGLALPPCPPSPAAATAI